MLHAPRQPHAIRRLMFAALVVVTAGFAGHSQGRELHGRVIGVTDGDTLIVLVDRDAVRVRLSDIDAPERGQPYGARARQSLAELCHERTATVTPAGHDRYGRTLGAVACAGVDANREQVKRGLAWVYVRYARRDSPLYSVQREARAQGRGLWQMADPQPPWEWRSRRRAGHAMRGQDVRTASAGARQGSGG